MTRCRDARAEVRAAGGTPPSYTALVVKACALALRAHPRANGAWTEDGIRLHDRVNVGVAVAAADALIVPTVLDADRKGVGEIARETAALAERVRAGTISPADLEHGTFTVSNLGMHGVDEFAAVINPPQAAILATGSIAERPIGRGGELVLAPVMRATLGCDHRILYGADGAAFLADVRRLLEAPLGLAG
jgi:pyruvate dehydrogenase E2 component (dihydrolipoamide acetyltransferase)